MVEYKKSDKEKDWIVYSDKNGKQVSWNSVNIS